MGVASPGGHGGGGDSTPANFPVRVQLGNVALPPNQGLTASRADPMGGWAPLEAPQEMGIDLAILWLDSPVFDERARSVRPSLTSPVPFDTDRYAGIGMAGWGGNRQLRQAVMFNTIDLQQYAQRPSNGGQTWVYDQHSVDLEGGDSGSPLFVLTPSGGRDVIGVESATWFESLDGGWRKVELGLPISEFAVANNVEGGPGRGRLEVFGRDFQGQVHLAWQQSLNDDDWGGPGVFHGLPAGEITAAVNPDGRIELFAVRPDGVVVHNWQNRDGSGRIWWQHP